MKSLEKLSLLLLVLVLSIVSCRDNLDTIAVDQQTPDPDIIEPFEPVVTNVNASLTGFVVDENDEPVSGATVNLGAKMTVTDEYGHFFFDQETMNSRGTLVKVEKSGYFEGSRRFFPLSSQESRVKIELIPQAFDESFNAQNGGKVSKNDGTSIEFSANSIQLADGEAYQGTVQVAMKWLDPTSTNTLDQMPGDLQGVSIANQEVALRTYGMMAVELRGTSGESLNIAEGNTATLTFPVPEELLGSAPAEVPLWSFNDQVGLWVEESKATLQGNNYVGEVSHFSFWNVDVPFDLVELSFQLTDENQQVLPNYQTVIKRENGFQGYGYSNNNGVVSGLVPLGEALNLQVFDLCGNVIYSEAIGPFNANTDLGTVVVNNSTTNTTVITGELTGCNAAALDNALIIVEFDGQTQYEYVDNGEFEIVLSTCTQTQDVQLKAVDLLNFLESEVINVVAGTQTDLGTVSICDQQFMNFITLTVDGTDATYPAMISISEDSTASGNFGVFNFIQSLPSTDQDYFIGFGFEGNTPGDYTTDAFLEGIFDASNNWNLTPLRDSASNNSEVFQSFIISEYGNPGQAVKGEFSSKMLNFTNSATVPDTVTVTGSFDVIRQ